MFLARVFERFSQSLPCGLSFKVPTGLKVDNALKFLYYAIKLDLEEYWYQRDVEKGDLLRAQYANRDDAAINEKIKGVTLELTNQLRWDEFVAKSTEGDGKAVFYEAGKAVIEHAERWGKLMQLELAAGKKLSDIAEKTCIEADHQQISGYMCFLAVAVLSETWKHGEELRRWHNIKTKPGKKGHIANEKGGLLNPALL
jgi:hypothetical protein